MNAALAARFWAKVRKSDGCWEWTAGKGHKGYGRFYLSRDAHAARAHRVGWELTNGPIPPGLFVCHRCDNPPCVRPDHLFLGTSSDNRVDCVAKGRAYTGQRPRGEAVHIARLTESDVLAIRRRHESGETQVAIAADFRVTSQNIYAIVNRLSWKHVA